MSNSAKANLRYMLIVTAFNSVLGVFCNTFLISKLYDLAENANQIICIFYIVAYITIPFTCLKFRKYFKTRTVEMIRCGVTLNALLIFFSAILNDMQLVNMYIIVAILFGISQAFYYIPFSIVVATYTGKNPASFCTASTIISNVANIIFPITLGKIIDVQSFKEVAAALLFIAFLQILSTFKVDKINNKEDFNFRKFFTVIKEEKEFKMVVINTARITFFKGIDASVLDRLILLLIKSMYNTNFELGWLTTLFSIITIAVNYLTKRFLMPKNNMLKIAKTTLIISVIATLFGIIIFLLVPDKNSFILFRTISSIFITIISLFTEVNHYETSAILGKFKTEFQIFTEFCLSAGRVGGFAILFIVDYFIGSVIAINAVIIAIAIIILFHSKTLIKNISINK